MWELSKFLIAAVCIGLILLSIQYMETRPVLTAVVYCGLFSLPFIIFGVALL